MKVAVINTRDVHGGAARAAYRLHKGLRNIGADSTYFVRDRQLDDPTIRQFVPDPSDRAVAFRQARKAELTTAYEAYRDTRSAEIELFSQERVDDDENFYIQRPTADVFNLHWVAGFVDYHLFFTPERTRSPVVWTLHDMNPLTCGCHYDLRCGQFRDHCGACPLLGSNQENDLTRRIFESKAKIFAAWPQHMLHIVAPSRWLQDAARSSTLFGKFDATCIPYGIETDIYRPADKLEARSRLGLPANAHIVLFVSHKVNLERKGFRELAHALSLFPDTDNLVLLTIGDKANIPVDAPFRVFQINYISDDHQVALFYNAADVTAVPSQQDNLPNTMVESLSCGTPVVGYRVGGIPDMVKDGETGFLAPASNVGVLSAAFVEAFSDLNRLRSCGARGRALVEKRHTLAAQAYAYTELYKAIDETARIKRGY